MQSVISDVSASQYESPLRKRGPGHLKKVKSALFNCIQGQRLNDNFTCS